MPSSLGSQTCNRSAAGKSRAKSRGNFSVLSQMNMQPNPKIYRQIYQQLLNYDLLASISIYAESFSLLLRDYHKVSHNDVKYARIKAEWVS